MKRIFCYIGLILFAAFPFVVQAQIPKAQEQLETIIESIIEEQEEETEGSINIEDLEEYAINPLNINTATSHQLSRLHLLNDIQINKLLEYRNGYGPIFTIYELNVIEGLDPEVLMRMEPFIFFGPMEHEPVKLSEILNYGRHEVLLRSLGTIQRPGGYKQDENGIVPFAGNRFRYSTRYRFLSGDNISAGFTAEKDPGEAFFSKSNQYGFDFYSAHLSFKISPFIQNITLGDFIVRSGQGLVLWQGFSLDKSLYVTDVYKTNQGIRPYTSADENQFFRGAATTLTLGDAKINFFFSKKNSDGNLVSVDSLGRFFTSLQTSGYHRTNNEIADKKSINDLNTGALGNLMFRNLKLGAVFLYRKFDLPFLPAEQLYNKFNFKGTENFAGGIDYLFSKGRYQLFGESAISKSGGKAVLQGATAYLHDRIQLSSLFRHFDKNYHALWSAPFAENNLASNETGLYSGIRILPVKKVTFSAYYDIRHSKWIKFNTAGPSNGWDVFAQVDFRPSDHIQLYVRYKNEENEKKFRIDEKNENFPEQFRKLRIHFQYVPCEVITLKSRIETVYYKGIKAENGIMIFQDAQISPARIPLNVSARIAWFNTDSYYSRIYAYENDLLYNFAIPAYYGNGYRIYIYMKYKMSKKLEVWLKMGNFLYNHVETIGSGYNEIEGNKKTELKFQLRLKI